MPLNDAERYYRQEKTLCNRKFYFFLKYFTFFDIDFNKYRHNNALYGKKK
jgi:hypothetical protein